MAKGATAPPPSSKLRGTFIFLKFRVSCNSAVCEFDYSYMIPHLKSLTLPPPPRWCPRSTYLGASGEHGALFVDTQTEDDVGVAPEDLTAPGGHLKHFDQLTVGGNYQVGVAPASELHVQHVVIVTHELYQEKEECKTFLITISKHLARTCYFQTQSTCI